MESSMEMYDLGVVEYVVVKRKKLHGVIATRGL